MKRLFPVITELDKELPFYVIDAAYDWNQEHIVQPDGYFYQWIQCVEGEGELLTDEKTYRIKEGMGMLLFQGVAHEYYAVSPDWIVDWIVFDGHQVDHFLKHTAGVTTSGALYVSRPDIFQSKIRSVLDTDESDPALTSLKYSSTLYSLLTDIVQYTSIHPNNSASDQYFRLKPLFHYIEQNYDKPLTLEAMADVIGITPQHLCTLFKKTTGVRIFQYIHSVRIKKSKELLLQYPQLQIKEVALMAGFEDANYFSSVFRKLEQISPNQFRKLSLARS
jgi:AraC family transcriptional regulator, arabinose operon regulatory protein